MARRGDSSFSWFVLGFKAFAVALMVGTPLLGVWIASSLAAFANRATWLPVAAGALLFPGLPLAWEGIARLRERSAKKPVRHFLTFGDRLILRTLALNVLFIGVLLLAWPQRAFVALSARGDWMLDGHHGATAERVRRGLLASAGALEWVYEATKTNPYKEVADKDHVPTPSPTLSANPLPVPTATASASASASASATASATASASATATASASVVPPPPPGPLRWPIGAALHPAVTSMPPEAETSIANVGRYIAEREKDPFQRVKALHDYVADRVAYDAPAYFAHAIPHEDGDAQAVFQSKKGVCAGYAHLLAELGKVTGDEIVYVVGDARSQTNPMEGESHAWNAAKIAGTWYLIDATWDAGHVDGSKYVKAYATSYLFTPPDVFAVQHHPDDDRWQLLERPLPRAEFFRRPVLDPSFYAFGLGLRTPDRSQVTTGGAIDIELDNPGGTFVLADFEPHGGGAHTDCKGDNRRTFHCAFPASGTYDVRVYASRQQYGRYAYAGAVQVNARP